MKTSTWTLIGRVLLALVIAPFSLSGAALVLVGGTDDDTLDS